MTDNETTKIIYDIVKSMDAKVDTLVGDVAGIKAQLPTFATREECATNRLALSDAKTAEVQKKAEAPQEPATSAIKWVSGNKRLVVPLSIFAAIAAAVVAIVQAFAN